MNDLSHLHFEIGATNTEALGFLVLTLQLRLSTLHVATLRPQWMAFLIISAKAGVRSFPQVSYDGTLQA